MILDCDFCYHSMAIKPDDREMKVNFCPHCGEAVEDDFDELDFD